MRPLQVEDDWNSINWEKINYMTRIGLRPWCCQLPANCALV